MILYLYFGAWKTAGQEYWIPYMLDSLQKRAYFMGVILNPANVTFIVLFLE